MTRQVSYEKLKPRNQTGTRSATSFIPPLAADTPSCPINSEPSFVMNQIYLQITYKSESNQPTLAARYAESLTLAEATVLDLVSCRYGPSLHVCYNHIPKHPDRECCGPMNKAI